MYKTTNVVGKPLTYPFYLDTVLPKDCSFDTVTAIADELARIEIENTMRVATIGPEAKAERNVAAIDVWYHELDTVSSEYLKKILPEVQQAIQQAQLWKRQEFLTYVESEPAFRPAIKKGIDAVSTAMQRLDTLDRRVTRGIEQNLTIQAVLRQKFGEEDYVSNM